MDDSGVGTQLMNILRRLGIIARPDCSCTLLAEIMDELGVEGCKANREKILKLLRKNQEKYGWKDYLRAGTRATVLGWAFKFNPTDPLPGLLDLAIEKAQR